MFKWLRRNSDDSFLTQRQKAEESATQKAHAAKHQRASLQQSQVQLRQKEKDACYQAGLKLGASADFQNFIKQSVLTLLADPHHLSTSEIDINRAILMRLENTDAGYALSSKFGSPDNPVAMVMNRVNTTLTRHFFPEDWPHVVDGVFTSLSAALKKESS